MLFSVVVAVVVTVDVTAVIIVAILCVRSRGMNASIHWVIVAFFCCCSCSSAVVADVVVDVDGDAVDAVAVVLSISSVTTLSYFFFSPS